MAVASASKLFATIKTNAKKHISILTSPSCPIRVLYDPISSASFDIIVPRITYQSYSMPYFRVPIIIEFIASATW